MKATIFDIIGQALNDAGVAVVTHVPGAGGNEIFAAYCHAVKKSPQVSFHEEVAYGVAHGAGIVGKRAAVVMKSHGLAKAANAVIASLTAGTNGGCVAVIADDKEARQSDNIFDCIALLRGMGMPFIIGKRERIYQDVMKSFQLSERNQLPYALVVDMDTLRKEATIKTVKPPSLNAKYKRNVFQHVVCPVFAQHQYKVLQAKRQKKNWLTIKPPIQPIVPHSLPDKWREPSKRYIALFSVFREYRAEFVTGDTGVSSLFAFRPYECIDATTYMGGSIPLAIGAYYAGHRKVWAVTGDFSFISAGQLGLLEASIRNLPMKILVIFNGQAEATGGQPVTTLSLHRAVAAYADNVKFIRNPQDRGEIKSVLSEATDSRDLRIVVANYTIPNE